MAQVSKGHGASKAMGMGLAMLLMLVVSSFAHADEGKLAIPKGEPQSQQSTEPPVSEPQDGSRGGCAANPKARCSDPCTWNAGDGWCTSP